MSFSGSSSAMSTDVVRQLSRGELPQEANDLLAWLARFSVEQNHPRATATNVAPLRKSDEVLVCRTFNTVSEVFDKLISENFLGCLVVDDKDEFYGMVGMKELVSHCLTSFDLWSEKKQEMINLNDEGSVWSKYWKTTDFRNTQISQITKLPNWKSKKSYFPVYPGFSLLYVMEQMARLGPQRVPILRAQDAKVTGILTQSMIISLMDQEMFRFGSLRDASVFQITQALWSNIQCININSTAAEAFRKMISLNVSGLPVVNDMGELLDEISVRDLRGIGPTGNNFDILFNSIGTFKEKCRRMYPTQTPTFPIYVTRDDTFSRVLLNMRDGNIHRIIVCAMNANNKPIPTHVITQRDLLRFVLYTMGMSPAPQQLPLATLA